MRKILNIIIVLLDILLIAFYVCLKLDYYSSVRKIDFSDLSIFDIIWIPVSILITVMPMLVQAGLILFMKERKQLFACLIPLVLIIGDFAFEFISMLGAAMNLDNRWSEMAEKMFACLFLFAVPMILAAISAIAEAKKRKSERSTVQ